ncbi:MAG: hypothetical protein HQ580_03535 [Planctomycetes bacterium]|nr:hypothetical protein [Planctomycetota bacterium]
MNPADKIKELINESDVKTSSDADKRILVDALEHLEILKQKKPAATQPNIWRIIMKGGVTKLAVAAAILITFAIGFSIGRWSKPTRLAPHSLDVTGYTSAVPVYPTAPKVEDSFWRQKALAAMHPRPYAQTQTTKTSLLNTYKQYLKEKHYD